MVAAEGVEGRWKSAGAEKSSGTLRAGCFLCSSCVAEGTTSSATPARTGADVVGAVNAGTDTAATRAPAGGAAGVGARDVPVKAATVVLSRVKDAVGRGEVLYWKDVAGWLEAERENRGDGRLTADSVRFRVRQMFDGIARMLEGKAREVNVRENSHVGGDTREKALCLFPLRSFDYFKPDTLHTRRASFD